MKLLEQSKPKNLFLPVVPWIEQSTIFSFDFDFLICEINGVVTEV